MALQRDTAYPGRFDAGDASHPQGAFKNRSTPTSEDGSYLEKGWLNDWSGFFGRLLSKAGITISGIADTATNSQYFEGVHTLALAWSQCTDAGAASAYILSNDVSPIKVPFNGMRVRFYATADSTGPSTVNFSDFDPVIADKSIKLQDGSDTGAGSITTSIENEIVYDGTNWVLVRGAATQVSAGGAFENSFFHVQDQKTSGTDGGDFNSGAWQTRTLNTVLTNQISASLASNQITLGAGEYYIEASAQGYRCSTHVLRLQDVTNAVTLLDGINADCASGDSTETHSYITGRFSLAGSADIELQHRCNTTKTVNGFGTNTGFATEVYSDVCIWKVG